METITKVNEYNVTGTFDIEASFKADKDSDEQKQVTLRVHMDNTPLRDVITKALSQVRIAWQNGPGRGKFNLWKNRQTVDIDFTSPAKSIKTQEELITEYEMAFRKAGLPKEQAKELAIKAVTNPDVIQ